MTKSEAQNKIKELQAFIEQLEERWEPVVGEAYWFVNGDTTIRISITTRDNLPTDNGRCLLGNCFKTKEEAEYHKLRLQSIAERGREPEEDGGCWYWDFRIHASQYLDYDKNYFSDYLTGNIHKTREDCEKWFQKYGKAFEVLGRGEDE